MKKKDVKLILYIVMIMTGFYLLLLKICSTDYNYHNYSENQWYISSDNKQQIDIGVKKMWKSFNNDKIKQNVIVAVIDGGIDISNSAISNNIWENQDEIAGNGLDDDNNGFIDDLNGWNFAENNNAVDDFSNDIFELNHGTKIAGIICADSKKCEVSGIVYGDWIKIMPLKVIKSSIADDFTIQSGKIDCLVDAINYAEKMGADICNISLNTPCDDKRLRRTIEESKMLFVVSAGNGSGLNRNLDKNPSYPASYNYSNVISVANIKSNGKLHSRSNYGQGSVEILAPGTAIYNIDTQNGYDYGTGTSYSTPIVTAIAAAIYATNVNMDCRECKLIICQTADTYKSLEKVSVCGRVINCQKAINAGN